MTFLKEEFLQYKEQIVMLEKDRIRLLVEKNTLISKMDNYSSENLV